MRRIVTAGSALRKIGQVAAGGFDAVDVADRTFGAGFRGNVIVDIQQIGQRFRAEDDLMAHWAFFRRSAWRARTVAKTCAAGMARPGSACIVS